MAKSSGPLMIDLPYKPMAKQSEAHQLSCKYRGFVGGWGNGKTSWGCVETFVTAMEYPGINAVVARKTKPELRATSWGMLMQGDAGIDSAWHGIPRELIASYNKTELILKLINGSTIFGFSLDDPRKLEGINLGFFWIDQAEEIEEEFFLKFHGRMRQINAPREGILTWNPAGHNWLWHRFIDPSRSKRFQDLYQCIEATTYDNPNLPDDYFDQFEGLPDAWIQRFVHGSHEVFTGQIFTDYDPNIHVIQPFKLPSTWERWLCIDPGIRHEGALSWVARDPEGNKYYYRELLMQNQPVSWWAEKIFEMEARNDHGGPNEYVFRRLIGPEARQRSQTDGKTVVDVFHEHGVFPEIADRDPSARISSITSALRPSEGHTHPKHGRAPAPHLYVFADCAKLLEYLPQYQWRPQRTNFAEEDAPEKPRKKDDHNIDCLGHILLAMDDVPPVEIDMGDNLDPRRMVEDHFDRAIESAGLRSDGSYAHSVLGEDY